VTPSPASELSRGALQAARAARREVAALMRAVESEHPDLAATLSGVVAHLFSAEVGGDDGKLLGYLEQANATLRALLDDDRWVTRDAVSQAISRALAHLHPARSALARSLGQSDRDDETEPFLLTSARIKPSSPPPDEDERRGARRADLEVEVGLEGNNRFYTGITGDLSAGGLFVATDTPLLVGTPLVLSFVLPDGYRIGTHASVAWVRAPRYRPDELPAGMGVKFEALSDEDRHALDHFLEARPPFRYGD